MIFTHSGIVSTFQFFIAKSIFMEAKTLHEYTLNYPLLHEIIQTKPVMWLNPMQKSMKDLSTLPLSVLDMEEASKRWKKFESFLQNTFPELQETHGRITSPLKRISTMKRHLNEENTPFIEGDLLLKCDNLLAVAGSVKARGGFYEVLQYAEDLALKHELLKKEESYEVFGSETFRNFFSQFEIGVGSTGNLGLSIGIMSASLGFRVTVYMSADAREWKKKLLRGYGVTVVENPGDFGAAVEEGRRKTQANPKGYFVDDENSKTLFLGYATAAYELRQQLEEQGVLVDEQNPLFVYLPCGVGGAPGGITFGLKQLFGDAVHCFFVEPTHAPSVLIGLLTETLDRYCTQDFGIPLHTEADGLATGRPSAFASAISQYLISGVYTLNDESFFKLLYELNHSESIFVEPSAAAGLMGPQKILSTDYLLKQSIDPANVTHIVWATGGLLVPEEDKKAFIGKGEK